MGPQSKESVCNAIGHLIDAVQGVEATLGRIERMLVRQAENDKADLLKVNQRISALERWRLNGGKPSTA
jgi:hypothetical protein